MTEPRTEADAIAEIISKQATAEIIQLKSPFPEDATIPGSIPLIARPTTGGQIAVESAKKLLEEYRTAPARRTGTARFVDLDSFILHVNRFKDEHSLVFANPDRSNPALTAVLNYHEKDATGAPRFGDHRSAYAFPLSDEWKYWQQKHDEKLDQEDFAQVIEDRIDDVIEPGAATKTAKEFADEYGVTFATRARLIELSKGLAINVGRKVVNQRNGQTGELRLQFEETHSDAGGGALNVPDAVLLSIPVVRNGPLYQVPARLRYRVNGGVITWWFNLHRTDVVFEDAFKESCDKVLDRTQLNVLLGSPES